MSRTLLSICLVAVLTLVPSLAARASEVSEAELIKRTTLDAAERSRREAAIAAMTPGQQGAAMVDTVNDRTIIYYQHGHGVFIEHTSKDGRVYMWYPRNKRIVHGTWGLRDFQGPKLCYKYLNSVHGITGEFEPNECIPPAQKLVGAEILDSRSGDPFGLAAGAIPYQKTALDVPDWPNLSKP